MKFQRIISFFVSLVIIIILHGYVTKNVSADSNVFSINPIDVPQSSVPIGTEFDVIVRATHSPDKASISYADKEIEVLFSDPNAGISCQPNSGNTDGNGVFKIRCKASKTGSSQLIFKPKNVGLQSLGNQVYINVGESVETADCSQDTTRAPKISSLWFSDDSISVSWDPEPSASSPQSWFVKIGHESKKYFKTVSVPPTRKSYLFGGIDKNLTYYIAVSAQSVCEREYISEELSIKPFEQTKVFEDFDENQPEIKATPGLEVVIEPAETELSNQSDTVASTENMDSVNSNDDFERNIKNKELFISEGVNKIINKNYFKAFVYQVLLALIV